MTQRRSRMMLGIAVVVVLVAAVLLTNVFPYRKILAQQQQVTNAEGQLEVLLAENERLETEAMALSTEAQARMQAYLAAKPQGKFGQHSYAVDAAGSRDRPIFAHYQQLYDVPSES